jgi:hypothetical protein
MANSIAGSILRSAAPRRNITEFGESVRRTEYNPSGMPLHDWTRVPPGLFHDFHQSWSIRITDALNAGCLPKGVAALVEPRIGPRESDVLAIERKTGLGMDAAREGGVLTLERPVTRIVRQSSKEIYAGRANRIVVRHHLGRIIVVIEIVSPGNKDSRAALRDLTKPMIEFLRGGIHVLVIDLFPPAPRDPSGIHKAIWDEIEEEPFVFPSDKDRIPVAVGFSARLRHRSECSVTLTRWSVTRFSGSEPRPERRGPRGPQTFRNQSVRPRSSAPDPGLPAGVLTRVTAPSGVPACHASEGLRSARRVRPA